MRQADILMILKEMPGVSSSFCAVKLKRYGSFPRSIEILKFAVISANYSHVNLVGLPKNFFDERCSDT